MLDGGAEGTTHCRAVMRYEEEADAITREVLIGVRSSFITLRPSIAVISKI